MENPKHELQGDEVKPSGYRVINVVLLESSFIRKTEVNLTNSGNLIHEIDVKPEAHTTAPDNQFAVTLNILYKGFQDSNQICTAEIKMIGIFEKYGEPALAEDKFKAVNAPAIIYPFIREHLHNLSLKAGIVNVLLPTINFRP